MARLPRKAKLGLSFEAIIPTVKAGVRPLFSFPDWAAGLRADASLTPGLRESYRQTLPWFGEFCRQRQAGTTVTGAREFVELARLERAPSPARLQEWKAALNWYFRRGRAAAIAIPGVPPLARTDLGQAGWERGLITRLRQRQCAWRTEQTYRGWLWRFVKWQENQGRGKSTPHPQARGTPSPPAPLPIGLGEGSIGPVEAEREAARADARPTGEISLATSYRGPWRLIYSEAYLEEADALGREKFLKSGRGRWFLKGQLRHYLLKHPLRSNRVTT